MHQLTELHTFKTSKFQKHCFEVLKDVYNIKPSHFIRQAIEEKLRREIPKLREKAKIKREIPNAPRWLFD